jgi:hypothetical protein
LRDPLGKSRIDAPFREQRAVFLCASPVAFGRSIVDFDLARAAAQPAPLVCRPRHQLVTLCSRIWSPPATCDVSDIEEDTDSDGLLSSST